MVYKDWFRSCQGRQGHGDAGAFAGAPRGRHDLPLAAAGVAQLPHAGSINTDGSTLPPIGGSALRSGSQGDRSRAGRGSDKT